MASQLPPPPSCLPGDLDQLSIAQGMFADIAGASRRTRNQLLNAGGQIVWSGRAHDVFESALKDVPYDLQKVQASFGDAASALGSYLSTLSELMPRYRNAYRQFMDCYDRLQGYNRQLSNIVPGLDVFELIDLENRDSSAQLKSQFKSDLSEVNAIYEQLPNLGSEMGRLWSELVYLYGKGASAAEQLKSALDKASGAGIQDNWQNTFGRYGGDVAGFVGGMVAGLVHDVEELVTALVNLGETLLKLAVDIAEGHWSAVGKDLDQILLDVNDIARSLTNILTTLAPILQFIPGVGEIVDIVMLVAAIATVGTDLVMMAAGGSAKDPLTKRQVNLRQAGGSHLLGDTVNLGMSILPGAGGVTDDMAKKATKDVVEASRNVSTRVIDDGISRASSDLSDAVSTGDFKAATEAMGKLQRFEARLSLHDLPAETKLGDLKTFRSTMSDASARISALSKLNPTVMTVFGQKISYQTFRYVSAVGRGVELGRKVSDTAGGGDPLDLGSTVKDDLLSIGDIS